MTIVPNFDRSLALPLQGFVDLAPPRGQRVGGSEAYWRVRAVLDVLGALALMPIVVLLGAALLILNPILNPGPLFYRQCRMGRGGESFVTYKFRTMAPGPCERGAFDPVEVDRITPLGRILRRMGLDELPQAINVLRREMSLIGPRPDCVHHAAEFLTRIPEYRQRLAFLPGMSGLSQIRHGYAVGLQDTRAKAATDAEYINRACFRLDAWIVWQTLLTMIHGRGD
ncbi:sugar transferase [Gymnodinialimonas ceratoperidinii]|uniref:Sugar transferase n=1 Tax=Gymnodinialimonas ceratoperidinii TaxID=2856823 RepID=A0A8F6TZG9_9RHOB|nr:sugar transferase [Gymnodinialimonas ceratoperidinii]QXT40577.1 sugar transferase [Gymnodinialimonas ceratoperidinii]